MTKHKTLGQVYTPDWIVQEILDLVQYQGSEILSGYILEPACGDGAFLIEIVKRYIYESKKNQCTQEEIVKGLETYIYGIEFDEEAYKKCLQNLNDVTQKLLGINHIHWNIFNKNTLHTYHQFSSYFDYIVGNPPYIRIHNLDSDTREFIKNHFKYTQGTIDIYLTFFEMALYMLKPKGKLGYITPNSYLHNSSYKQFREFLKVNKSIHTLIDFKANKIFKGFSTYTAITILELGNSKDTFNYKELQNDKIQLVNTISFNDLDLKDWSFTDKKNEQFLTHLHRNKHTSIHELYEVQYGFATLRDKIFIGTIKPSKENSDLVYFNEHLIESKLLKPCIKGSKYKGELDPKTQIIFPYKKVGARYEIIPEEELKEIFPNGYQYLLKNKKELMARDIDKGAKWYAYGRSQGVQSMHSEKIILSTLVNGAINYFKVDANIMMYSGLFITKKNPSTDWQIIENLLSSDEFYQYIRITGKDFSGGYKSITSKQIKNYKV